MKLFKFLDKNADIYSCRHYYFVDDDIRDAIKQAKKFQTANNKRVNNNINYVIDFDVANIDIISIVKGQRLDL